MNNLFKCVTEVIKSSSNEKNYMSFLTIIQTKFKCLCNSFLKELYDIFIEQSLIEILLDMWLPDELDLQGEYISLVGLYHARIIDAPLLKLQMINETMHHIYFGGCKPLRDRDSSVSKRVIHIL